MSASRAKPWRLSIACRQSTAESATRRARTLPLRARLVSWLRERRLTGPRAHLAAPFHRPTSSSMPRSHRLKSVWLKRPQCRSRCIRCSSPADPRQCCSLGSQSNWKRWTPNARHHRLSDIPCARHRVSWEYLRPSRRPCCRSHHAGLIAMLEMSSA